jgi:hypothetical protein
VTLVPALAMATATRRVSDFTKDLAELVESRCSTVQVFVEDQKVAPRQAGKKSMEEICECRSLHIYITLHYITLHYITLYYHTYINKYIHTYTHIYIYSICHITWGYRYIIPLHPLDLHKTPRRRHRAGCCRQADHQRVGLRQSHGGHPAAEAGHVAGGRSLGAPLGARCDQKTFCWSPTNPKIAG